jgi:8-oxo-dGTP pyrophosphatase MutT (NUDIX family)
MSELWDVYDINRVRTGRTVQRGPMAPDEFHIVVNVWIKNSRGEYLISKRSPGKPYALLWECTGGSAVAGEDSLTAAIREAKEELGVELDTNKGTLIRSFCRAEPGWSDFVDVWLFSCEWPIERVVLQEGETCSAMWVTREKILDMLDRGEFLSRELLPYIDELMNFCDK